MASSRSSDLKSADAAIAAGANRVNAVTLLTDGTNAASVILYDNATAASGKVLAKVKATGAELIKHVLFENPVYAENGIYADVTGTNAEYIVYYGG
jgi:hypothetical protein